MNIKALPPYYKVGIVGAGLMLIIVAVVAVGYYSTYSVYRSAESFALQHYPTMKMALSIDRDLYQGQLALEWAMRMSDPLALEEQLAEYRENIGQSTERYETFQRMADDLRYPEGLLSTYVLQREAWGQATERVAQQIHPQRTQEEMAALADSLDTRAMTKAFAVTQATLDRAMDEVLEPLLTLTGEQLPAHRRQAELMLAMTLIVALLAGSWLTFAGVMTTRAQHLAIMAEKEERDRESQHKDFERRVQRGMELAQTEAGALGVVRDAVNEVLMPDRQGELLLADSSMAHLDRVIATDNAVPEAGCKVSKPHDCPAIRRNATMHFPTSKVFEACPFLKGRGPEDRSASCMPISIMGQTMGVLHTVGPAGVLPSAAQFKALTAVVGRAGDEIGLVRAFATKDRQANTDSLTGLLNRRSLELQLGDIRARPNAVYSVAFADLDHFKKLNDVHGHETGDRALRVFADVLRATLRPTDIAARWGGEEFVIVLPEAIGAQTTRVLERIRENLAERLAHGSVPRFTVSFGVCDSEHSASFDTILSAADDALLSAKREGRDRIVYYRWSAVDDEALAQTAPPMSQAELLSLAKTPPAARTPEEVLLDTVDL